MGRKNWILPLILFKALVGLLAQDATKIPDDTFQLGLVLKSARQYCARLEKAALDFICLEEVSESLDPGRDRLDPGVKISPLDTVENTGTSSQGGLTSRGTQARPMAFNSRPCRQVRQQLPLRLSVRSPRRQGQGEARPSRAERQEGRAENARSPG
ncbi:MAG: hypothetical protein MZU84_06285 [Sphingobacterium sp.]|nr:hypothetical protein [Sphingobacterium sp.]